MKDLDLIVSEAGVAVTAACGSASVARVESDSRRVREGDLFVCMPSLNRDSHEFMGPAREAGAAAFVVHGRDAYDRCVQAGWPCIYIHCDPKGDWAPFLEAIGLICRSAFGDPTAAMRVVGITGTNGKTTTAWIVRDALRALGRPSSYLGTLGFAVGDEVRNLENTTPFPVELHGLLADARAAEVTDFVMETSSHALKQRRVAGVRYDVGVFTNLSQDHLDFHGTMEDYADSKRRLFDEVAREGDKPFVGVLNAEDDWARRWLPALRQVPRDDYRLITFGLREGDLIGEPLRVGVGEIDMRFRHQGQQAECRIGLGGGFNVQNALAAMGTLLALGHGLAESAEALSGVRAAPGRFESVPNPHGIGVLVDYAHTPDAVEKLLEAAKGLNPSRLIAVLGCGGDRDRTKRPKMARAASTHADLTIVTSDNPRTEDPEAILDEIVPGLVAGKPYERIADRRTAIHRAIEIAQPGDLVVIAGKGHEDYQIIGRTKYPMDDRKMAREALDAR